MGIFLQFKCHSHANLIFWLLPFMFNFFQSCSTLMECLSPIDGVGLSYFEKCLKPPEKKSNLYTSLQRGLFPRLYIQYYTSIHFVGTNRKIQPQFKLQKFCLKICSQHLNFFFSERKQSDANICGVWLVAEMSSYLMNLQEINFRQT